MNKGQWQADVGSAEKKLFTLMSNGDRKQMKASTEDKFIFVSHLIYKGN